MIQCNKFQDGAFVLHKVEVNGHKYSVWFGKDGKAFSAEMVKNNGNTQEVPARSVNLWNRFNEIGQRFMN